MTNRPADTMPAPQEPAIMDNERISEAWNKVRAEARALNGDCGIGELLAAVEAYADVRVAARQEQQPPCTAEPVEGCPICEGTGRDEDFPDMSCPLCFGSGKDAASPPSGVPVQATVYELSNKTTSVLFANKEDAIRAAASSTAAVHFTVTPRTVHGVPVQAEVMDAARYDPEKEPRFQPGEET